MATKLKNLVVSKVDFVDAGANQGADIKLFKRKESEVSKESIPHESVWKKFMRAVGKKVGIDDGEIDTMISSTEEVQKGNSQTFGEKMTEVKRSKVADEIWNICYALQCSLQSILYDEDLDGEAAKSMMEQSVSEFDEIISEALGDWSAGKICGIKKNADMDLDIEVLKKFRERLDKDIQGIEKKGELEDMMRIDKSKMTPEERASYEEIIKKYGVEVEEEPVIKATVKPGENEEEIEDEETEKGCGGKKTPAKKSISEPDAEPAEDIYKGLHPAVKAEIIALRKFQEAAETKEFMNVAKKYEVIGKKPEELAPVLKSLHDAGGTAYNDMIGILDSALALANAGGAFEEIGKSSHGFSPSVGVAKSSSEGKIETIAKGYMEKDPNLTLTDAIAKAWENNPQLMNSYEEEAGF